MGIGGNVRVNNQTFLNGITHVTNITPATGPDTGALQVDGGVGINGNIHVENHAYVEKGLITNTGGVTKKTYSFKGVLANSTSANDAEINLAFTDHVFHAKVVAILVEGNSDVSTLSFEVTGGYLGGASTGADIARGPVSVFGTSIANPWNNNVVVTDHDDISFKPSETMAAAGSYNIFVEYISPSSSGQLESYAVGSGSRVNFDY